MPNNVDEKVVQMTFDNKQFEKGVAQSLKSLEDLKKALELDKMNNSLRNLENVSNTMSKSFGEIEASVKHVANVFTPLGRVVNKVMDDMARTVVSKAKSFAMLATGMESMQEGAQKYEKYTKSVQVITNATGKSVDEVSKHLDKLLKYTDETSYDFAEMVSSIGKFTSVGIDLERAEAAMEGIANWAAKSGAGKAEANRAMYNISQAMGAGYMKLIDWKSIENANMATKEFKEVAIQTAEELGVISKNSGITYQNFNETLKDGWLTADVMTEVLSKYSDTSTDFGLAAFHAAQEALTFTDAIDALKDAMSSGWMKSREYLFGNLDEARVMWTDFANALIEFSDIFTSARNELLKGWHELGGYKAAIEGVSNAWQAFMNIAYGIRDALATMLPDDLPKRLVDITESFRDITESWKNTFGIDTELKITKEVNNLTDKAKELNATLERGSKNDYVKTLQEQLIKGGYLRDKYGADGIYGPNTQQAVRKLQKDLKVKVTGSWDEATRSAAIAQKKFIATEKGKTEVNLKNVEAVTELQKKEIDHAKKLNKNLKYGDKSKEVTKLQKELVRLGYLSDESQADGIYGPKTKSAVEKLQKDLKVKVTGSWDDTTRAAAISKKTMKEWVEEEVTVYKKTSGLTASMKTIQDIVMGVASAIKIMGSIALSGIKIVGGVLSMFKPLIQVGGTVLAMFGDMISNFAKTIESEDGIATTTEKIIGFFKPLGDAIIIVSRKINDFVKGYFNFLQAGRKENTFKNFFDYLLEFASGNQLLSGFLRLFDNIRNVVVVIVDFISSAFQSIFSDNNDTASKSPKKNGLIVFLSKLLDIVTVIVNGIAMGVAVIGFLLVKLFNFALKYIGPIARGIGGFFGDIIKDFKNGNIKSFSNFFGSLTKAFSKTEIGKFFDDTSSSISGFFNKVKDYFLRKFPNIFSTFKAKWKSFKSFMAFDSDKGFLDNIKDKFIAIKTAIPTIISNIKEKLLEFKEQIAWLFTRNDEGKLNLFVEITNVVSKLRPLLDKLISFKDKFVEAIQAIFGATEGEGTSAGKSKGPVSVLDRVKAFLKSVAEFDFGKYLIPAIGSLVAYGLFSNLRAIKNFSEGLAGLISGEVRKKDTIGDTALKIAGAAAALALAIGLLSVIDAGKAEAGVGVMVSILGAFLGASALFGKIKDSRDMGKQLLMVAASIGVLAAGLWLMMKVVKQMIADPGAAALALGAIALFIVGMWKFMASLKKVNGTNANVDGILQMCLGVGVLVLAVGAMIDIVKKSGGNLGPALGIITGMVVALGVLEWALIHEAGKSSSGEVESKISGIIQMCIGIQFLVGAFGSLVDIVKKSKWEDLTWASGIMVGMLTAVGLIAYSMSHDVSKESVGKGIVLAGDIIAFAYALKMIAESFADAIVKVQGTDPWVIVAFLGGVAVCVGVMSSIASGLGALPLTVLVKGGVALLVLAGIIGAAIAILADVTTSAMENFSTALWVCGSKLSELSDFTKEIDFDGLEKMGSYLTDTLPPMMYAIIGLPTDNAISAASKLSDFGAQLWLYAALIGSLSSDIEDKSAKAEALASGAKRIEETINSISYDKSSVEDTLVGLGSALKLYYESIQDIGEDSETGNTVKPNVTKIDSQLITDAFTALKEAIPTDDVKTFQSFVEGGDNDMYKVAKGITALGTALSGYATDIGGLNSTSIGNANSIIETFKSIYTTVGKNNNISDFFGVFEGSTEEKMDNFIGNFVKIGEGMKKYTEATNGIDEDKFKIASKTLYSFVGIAKQLPKTGGFLKFFTGSRQSLSNFASNFGSLGAGIANFTKNLNEGSFEQIGDGATSKIDIALGAIERIAGMLSMLENSGGIASWFTGDKDLSVLGKGLPGVGSNLVAFETIVGGFKYDHVSEALDAFEKIVGWADKVQEIQTFDKWGNAENKFTMIGDGIKGMFESLSGIYTGSIEATVKEGNFIGWGKETVAIPIMDAMSHIGEFMTDGIVSGIDASNGGEDGSGKIRSALMRAIIDGITAIRKIQSIYIDTGEYLIDGLLQGIGNKYQDVIDKLDELGKKSAEALQKATEVESPSKLFYWIAEMWIEGLTDAISDNKDNPMSALLEVTDNLTDSLFIGGSFYNIFDSLISAADKAAKKYKESASSIVNSNDEIKRSTSQKPKVPLSEGLSRKNIELIKKQYSKEDIISAIEDSDLASDRTLKRIATDTKAYEYSKELLEDSRFTDYQKMVEEYDKQIKDNFLDPTVSRKKFWEYGNSEGIRSLMLKRRIAQLEQFKYLDTNKKNSNGKYSTKYFYQQYTDFLRDIGYINGKGTLKYNTNLDMIVEDFLDKQGGIDNARANKRRIAVTQTGWVANMKDFESEYGSNVETYYNDYMRQLGEQGGEDYIEGFTGIVTDAINNIEGTLGLSNTESASGSFIEIGRSLLDTVLGVAKDKSPANSLNLRPVFDQVIPEEYKGLFNGNMNGILPASVSIDEASKVNLGNIESYTNAFNTKLQEVNDKVNSLSETMASVPGKLDTLISKDGNVYIDGDSLVGKIGSRVSRYIGAETLRVSRAK